MTNELLVSPLLTGMVCIIAMIYPTSSSYWFMILAGGAIAVAGMLIARAFLIDIGMFVSSVTFLYTNRTLNFNPTTLMVILIIFFLFFLVWALDRRSILTRRIKIEQEGNEGRKTLKHFELRSTLSIVTAFILSLSLTYVGAMIAAYSALGIGTSPSMAVPMAVIFGTIVMITLFLILRVLPKYSEVD